MTRSERIRESLAAALGPVHLEVVDESHMHNVPAGAESHFKVIAVSDRFAERRLVERHRLVNQVLKGEFARGLHALALHTLTPEEWFDKGGAVTLSPLCMGGSKAK